MFTGTFYHSLEGKGRFSLPKNFRQTAQDWVLTAGLDGCLFIFEKKQWEIEAEKLQQLSYYQAEHRALIRHLAAHASIQQTDSLGRLSVPADLKQLADLKKNLVIVGVLDRIEVWDTDRYHQLFDKLDNQVNQINLK